MENSEVVDPARRRRLRRWSIVLFVVALPLAVAGFMMSFGVELAYLTSHGSAWLSPAAERLRLQAHTGRALGLAGGILFGISIWIGVRAQPRSLRDGWWLILPFVGAALSALHLVLFGTVR